MRRFQWWLGVAALLVGVTLGSAGGAVAQEGPGTDWSFSNQTLATLGLPEITLRQMPDGTVEGAPAEVAAGRYLVSLTSVGEVSSYVNFVQLPARISEDEATAQVLETASQDVPHAGYVYGGGSFTLENETAWFVVDLMAGDWRTAMSYQAGGDGEEIMQLFPLTVTAGLASPAASTPAASAIPASVRVQLRDVAFSGLEQPVPAGPQIWEITNVGEQPRQVVFWRTNGPVTVEQFQQMMAGMMTGTPVPAAPTFDQFTGVAYAAILSPGKTVWLEPDLTPGTYMVVSYVFDPESGQPAFALGMVQPFTVAGDDATPDAGGATPTA
jgi:hypothetical protein